MAILLRQESTIIAAWPLCDDPRAAAQARRLISGTLTGLRILPNLVEDAVLMVSELAGNAVTHGRGPFELVVRSGQDELYIEVVDSSLVSPVMRAPDAEAEHGRGLAIVSELTKGRCGFRVTAFTTQEGLDGKAVWFAIPMCHPFPSPRRSSEGNVVTIDGEKPGAWLQELATELESRRFSAQLRVRDGRPPFLTVINLAATVLSETVYVATDAAGECCFYFPWPGRIAPVSDVMAAADRIERVLAEIGR
ncbi:ATP-binding protein [Sphaerisporangium sp. NPDC049003]|uniref:ATP-binding protein n=1 Tax=Sphaerisporangium sp. NPDC049003 TaxID=3364517 RepID=UPI00371BF371